MQSNVTDKKRKQSSSPPQIISKNQQKKLKKKQRKADDKNRELQNIQELRRIFAAEHTSTQQSSTSATNTLTSKISINNDSLPLPGKAARAKAAKQGQSRTTSVQQDWRARAFANATSEVRTVINVLEAIEKEQRLQFRSNLITRQIVPVDCHGELDMEENPLIYDNNTVVGVSHRSSNLRIFSMEMISTNYPISSLLSLDLSRNELCELPKNLKQLSSLTSLNVARNWFTDIPIGIQELTSLKTLDMTHNMLQASNLVTSIHHFKNLKNLQIIDIQFNSNCSKQLQYDRFKQELLPNVSVQLKMSILWYEGKTVPEGTYVGKSAADRNATLLRSQLEPWSTTALRRRLGKSIQKRKRACIAYMESTVVSISIPPLSFKPVSLSLSRSPLF